MAHGAGVLRIALRLADCGLLRWSSAYSRNGARLDICGEAEGDYCYVDPIPRQAREGAPRR